MEEEKRKKSSKVSAWGIRLTVPAECLRWLELKVGDYVRWELTSRDGKRAVILQKAEVSGDD